VLDVMDLTVYFGAFWHESGSGTSANDMLIRDAESFISASGPNRGIDGVGVAAARSGRRIMSATDPLRISIAFVLGEMQDSPPAWGRICLVWNEARHGSNTARCGFCFAGFGL